MTRRLKLTRYSVDTEFAFKASNEMNTCSGIVVYG